LQLINSDNKNRKMTMELAIVIVVDSVYAIDFKIGERKKIFFRGNSEVIDVMIVIDRKR
jgi:hypothetical protein